MASKAKVSGGGGRSGIDVHEGLGRPPTPSNGWRARDVFAWVAGVVRAVGADRRGNVAVVFGLAAILSTTAVGAGIDLARTYLAGQQLSAAAQLTCQYATRQTVISALYGQSGTATYVGNVSAFLSDAMQSQNVSWTQSNASPFSYTTGGAATVSLNARVPTTVMGLLGVRALPVSATQTCFNTVPLTPPTVAPAASGTVLIKEGFENAAGPTSFNWYTPSGGIEAPTAAGQYSNAALNTPPSTPGYVGVNGVAWIIMGYCLEVDTVGVNVSAVPEGTHNAELDCDNGNGTAGNSSISTKTYLQAGAYELRWGYAARIPNTYYQTSYICGTTAADTSWANDTSYSAYGTSFGARTNQVNVYLDRDTTGAPPTHATLDGTQTLGGSNMIDECVYSSGWVQRSVAITVTTPGFYWLSFAADGASDSYGGQIDNILLCASHCSGTVSDNFPTSWQPANNGGNDAVLFEDKFESPSYGSGYSNANGNIGLSTGSSDFWGEEGKGWSNAPVNQTPYWLSGCPQGVQCVDVGGNNSNAAGSMSNSLISRPFLLDPGYYQISYDYVPEVAFSGLSATYCGTTPVAAQISTLMAASKPATLRVRGTYAGKMNEAANAVGVFMSHAQLESTPNFSTTLGATTSFTNPDGTTTTTPASSPSAISLTNYNAAQNNPLLDLCVYATTAQARSRDVYIQKPAFYWLTFGSLNTIPGVGGAIDDVKITALGGPSMASTPSNFVTIPVPAPQVGATINFSGFSIVEQP